MVDYQISVQLEDTNGTHHEYGGIPYQAANGYNFQCGHCRTSQGTSHLFTWDFLSLNTPTMAEFVGIERAGTDLPEFYAKIFKYR